MLLAYISLFIVSSWNCNHCCKLGRHSWEFVVVEYEVECKDTITLVWQHHWVTTPSWRIIGDIGERESLWWWGDQSLSFVLESRRSCKEFLGKGESELHDFLFNFLHMAPLIKTLKKKPHTKNVGLFMVCYKIRLCDLGVHEK